MKTPIPSQLVKVLAAWILCVSGASGLASAGDKKPLHIGAVLLRDLDASQHIPQDSCPQKAQTLKHRSLPGYALSSVLWSAGSNSVAALLANGADPNAKSKDGDPILYYALFAAHQEPIEDLLKAGAVPILGFANRL